MNTSTKEIVNEAFKRELGISYDRFLLLDPDEQQKIMDAKKESNKKHGNNYVTVMIGSGEHATFVKMKRGTKYMLEDGTIAIAGDTLEQAKNKLDSKIDDICSKTKTK